MASRLQICPATDSILGVRRCFELAPRLVGPQFETGFVTLDAVLQGGFPVARTSELVGERTSGRTTVAAAYVAKMTREGHVCAWVDVGGELDGGVIAANGGDLQRLLVVRCLGKPVTETYNSALQIKANFTQSVFSKDKTIGTPGVQNRSFADPSKRIEPVDTDRMPARRGLVVLERRDAMRVFPEGHSTSGKAKAQKPWSRLEQAIKAVDLLIQAGGFGAIVFDVGSVAPEYVLRIPLATWFRWRTALVRTGSSLVVLSQTGCTGSSAEFVLRVQAEVPEGGTVLQGGEYRLKVVRSRFAEDVEQRRGPQRAGASTWESRAMWRA